MSMCWFSLSLLHEHAGSRICHTVCLAFFAQQGWRVRQVGAHTMIMLTGVLGTLLPWISCTAVMLSAIFRIGKDKYARTAQVKCVDSHVRSQPQYRTGRTCPWPSHVSPDGCTCYLISKRSRLPARCVGGVFPDLCSHLSVPAHAKRVGLTLVRCSVRVYGVAYDFHGLAPLRRHIRRGYAGIRRGILPAVPVRTQPCTVFLSACIRKHRL